jgi:hypothetical protein
MYYTTEEQFKNLEINHEKHLAITYIVLSTIVAIIIVFVALCGYSEASVIDMNAIYTIESSNNPKAYNKSSKAKGLGQTTPIVLEEWNNLNSVKYTSDDLFNPIINKKISNWYMNYRIPQMLRYYKKEDSINNRLIAYNCGISCVINNHLPTETRNYIEKYRKIVR